jgi:hypothetical protein
MVNLEPRKEFKISIGTTPVKQEAPATRNRMLDAAENLGTTLNFFVLVSLSVEVLN